MSPLLKVVCVHSDLVEFRGILDNPGPSYRCNQPLANVIALESLASRIHLRSQPVKELVGCLQVHRALALLPMVEPMCGKGVAQPVWRDSLGRDTGRDGQLLDQHIKTVPRKVA